MKFRWACELALNGRLGKLQEIQVSVPGGRQGAAAAGTAGAGLRGLGSLGRAGPHDAVPRGEAPTRHAREHHQLLAGHDLLLGHPSSGHRPVGQRHGRHRPVYGRGHGRVPAVRQPGRDPALAGAVRVRPGRPGDVCQRRHARASPTACDSSAKRPGYTSRAARSKAATTISCAIRRTSTTRCRSSCRSASSTRATSWTRSRIARRAICDIEAAVRSDTLCQLALIAVKQGRKLAWDPQAERFPNDDAANALLQPRPFRGDWKLPAA